ncbi:MAG: hypothetical protein IIC79_06605, partial [Chloroflexi bacterium]|nr:hypothetical protein [Chloroflexota bacterium]
MITPKFKPDETRWDRQMRKIWTTRGARLEAARRLTRSGKASRWVVVGASIALIG